MARKPRIYYQGAFYHVMLRGNGGENIFFENEDREKFLLLISECICRFNFRVHAFCLMSNHVHLALQVGEISLSKIIQNISFRYTRIINKKRNRIGHLFQGRYKAIIVDADNYFLQLIQYIHLNPVKAKIVIHPEDYLWSSHRVYLRLSSLSWLTTNYALGYFSDSDAHALVYYKNFISETISQNIAILDIENKKSFPVVCDDSFMKKLDSMQNDLKNKPNLTLNQIIKFACEFYHIEEMQLHTKSRCRFNAKIRAVIAWLTIEFKICSVTTVASYFKREHSTVTRILNRIALSSEICELQKIKELIENALTQA